MVLAIFKHFEPTQEAIQAIQDKLTAEEFNALTAALDADVIALMNKVIAHTTQDKEAIDRACRSFLGSMDHQPSNEQSFAAGAQYAASLISMSIVSLPAEYTPTSEIRAAGNKE